MVAIQETNTATPRHHVNHLSHLDTKKVSHLDLGNVVYNVLLKIVSLMYSKLRTCRCIHCIAGSQRNVWWVLAPCACPARRLLSASLTGYKDVALTIITPVKLSFTHDASFHPTGPVAPFPHVAMCPRCLACVAASGVVKPMSNSNIGLPSSTSQSSNRPVSPDV